MAGRNGGSGAATPPEDPLAMTPESRRGLIRWSIDKLEGGYVNHPNDRGGPTKFGVTQRALDDYKRITGKTLGPPRSLARPDAEDVYDALISNYRLDQIADPTVREQVIDIAVTSGIGTAGQLLLDVLQDRGYGVRTDPKDHVIGSRTLGVIRNLVDSDKSAELNRINNALLKRREQQLKKLIQTDPTQAKFEKNWFKRAPSFRVLPTGRVR